MGQRVIRVNELLKREISHLVHTRYRGRATVITITDVDTAPNLRKAKVFYSVIGDADAEVEARAFFRDHGRDLRAEVGKVIVLKFLPHLEFFQDRGAERGARLDAIFDELGLTGETPSGETPPPPIS